MSKVLCIITYQSSGYTSTYKEVHLGENRKACEAWMNDFLNAKGNTIRDVKVYMSDSFEEYKAERIWDLKLTSTTAAGKVTVQPKDHGLEV